MAGALVIISTGQFFHLYFLTLKQVVLLYFQTMLATSLLTLLLHLLPTSLKAFARQESNYRLLLLILAF